MPRVLITRTETGDDGTFGVLRADAGFECYSLELPWRDLDGDGKSDAGNSCIPAGTYEATWEQSPTRKNRDGSAQSTYKLVGVKGREGILIHSANWAGDKSKGYFRQLEGCISLGRSVQEIELPPKIATKDRKKQKGVTSSVDAVSAFECHMERESFTLTIVWADGISPEKKKEAA